MSEGFFSRGFRGRRQQSDQSGRPPPGQYLERGFSVLSAARELYEQMLALYPDRVNPGALWTSARALKP
jgi:hypothetical protein